jgi:hypothetical protein
MGSGECSDGLGTSGAVDIQDVEQLPGGEANVGQGMASPPGQDPGPVTGGIVDAMGDQ